SARANAYWGAAHLAAQLADYPSAIVGIEKALALWRQVGDDRGVATGLHRLGNYLVSVGESERGMLLLEESVTLARTIGEPLTLAVAINTLSAASWYLG